jgi:hypothetical protein
MAEIVLLADRVELDAGSDFLYEIHRPTYAPRRWLCRTHPCTIQQNKTEPLS